MNIKLCNSFYYRIKPKDSMADIVSGFNADQSNIFRNNREIDLYAGEWVYVVQNEYLTHIVKPCECLQTIADKYGVSKEKIKIDNDLKNDRVFIGQRIKIYKIIN